MELHKEEVLAASFLEECFFSFRAEAVEREVTLDCATRPKQPVPAAAPGRPLPTAHGEVNVIAGSVFKAEASDGGVEREGRHLPLLPEDKIMLDKFKANQVVRNLVSNALKVNVPRQSPTHLASHSPPPTPHLAFKFSPKGSTVTLKAVFVPDPHSAAVRAVSSSSSPTTPWSIVGTIESLRNIFKSRASVCRGSLINGRSGSAAAVAAGSSDDLGALGNANRDVEANVSSPIRAKPMPPSPSTGMLRISVIDRGAGISPANQKRLFKVRLSPTEAPPCGRAQSSAPPHVHCP